MYFLEDNKLMTIPHWTWYMWASVPIQSKPGSELQKNNKNNNRIEPVSKAGSSPYYSCCGAPRDMGHMFGCPNSPENNRKRLLSKMV
jgi:hypothetical protein